MATEVCVAGGFCEAMTRSVVGETLEVWGSPWGTATSLVCRPPLVRAADRLRRTLLPSLAEARSGSLAAGANHGDLFEIARAYVQRVDAAGAGESPVDEPLLLAAVTGGDFFRAKGIAAAIMRRIGLPESPAAALSDDQIRPTQAVVGYRPLTSELFAAGRAAEIVLCRPDCPSRRIGVVGELASPLCDEHGLALPVAAIELRLDGLEFLADTDQERLPLSGLPAIDRDINLVVDESVPWAAVVAAIESVGCRELETVRLGEIWRDTERLGPQKKSFVVSLRLRSHEATLSADQANSLVADMVTACTNATGGVLRG